MKTCNVEELFSVRYGVNLELNALVQDEDGINFVSRTSKNNGVSAKVKPLSYIEPLPAGTITVAGGGICYGSFPADGSLLFRQRFILSDCKDAHDQ